LELHQKRRMELDIVIIIPSIIINNIYCSNIIKNIQYQQFRALKTEFVGLDFLV